MLSHKTDVLLMHCAPIGTQTLETDHMPACSLSSCTQGFHIYLVVQLHALNYNPLND